MFEDPGAEKFRVAQLREEYTGVCVCMCVRVCVREGVKERERERDARNILVCVCVYE